VRNQELCTTRPWRLNQLGGCLKRLSEEIYRSQS
jgi:hypothetical protein